MEKQITIEKIYLELKKIERVLKEKGIMKEVFKIPETALLSEERFIDGDIVVINIHPEKKLNNKL